MSATVVQAEDLQHGFAEFIAASRRLEASHAALRRRADAIDLELAAANRELMAALAEKEAILRALPVGVLRVSAAGTVLWRNAEAERLAARVPEAELAGLAAGETLRQGDCLSVRRAALADGGALVVVEDRSTLARLQREVDRLDRLAGLSELALGIAHEIKNPLNGTLGFAALLQRSDDPELVKRWAGKVAGGLAEVDGIVKEMLAFACGPGRDDARLLASIVDAAAAQAEVPRARVTLRGDATHAMAGAALVRVLANLLRNSVEAGAGAITVTAECRGERLLLEVLDDGPGVPAELGALAGQASAKATGHGLGLKLAARVLAFLGGSLELVNPGQRGARFRVTLPAAPGGGNGRCA